MIAIKTSMFDLPEYCDDCRYYQCSPHPIKGWSDFCGLCCECMDDDCKEGWLYDGNSRPEKCPLFIVPEERTCRNLAADEDTFCCSECRNETHGFMVDDFGCTVGFGIVVAICPNCGAKVVEE